MYTTMMGLYRRMLYFWTFCLVYEIIDYSLLRIDADEFIVAIDLRGCALIVIDMALRAHIRERAQLVAGGRRRQLGALPVAYR
jgi:hypothetical protein